MRRFFILLIAMSAIAIILTCAPHVGAAVYYVDFTCSGCDTTGSGTSGDPWETIGKCTTSGATTGGDECRVAKYAVTATGGNLTFTNGSTSVTTAVDETSNISAGDYVGLNNGLVSASDEAWWEVSSLNASTITLVKEYWGDGSGGAAQGYIANTGFVTTATLQINSGGSSTSSRLKISGGWDLTGPTQNGQTFIDHNTNNYLWDFNSNDYVEISNFTIYLHATQTYNDWYTPGQGGLVKDYIGLDNYFHGMGGGEPEDYNTFENVIQAGGSTYAYSISERFNVFNSCKAFSSGDSANDHAIYVSSSSNIVFIDTEVYNAYHHSLYIYASNNLYLENTTLKETRYSGSDSLSITASTQVVFNNVDMSDSNDDAITISATTFDVLFVNASFTNIGGDNVVLTGVNGASPSNHRIRFVDYDDTSGDDRIYLSSNTTDPYIQRDTTDARSGTCLKFYPTGATYPMVYRIGTFKATDGSSNATLSVYMKDDVSFNGEVHLFAEVNGIQPDRPTVKTMTTSYVQQSITVSSADFATDDYIHLYAQVTGTAGSVYVDDFSASN
jgi:hypothetical protein